MLAIYYGGGIGLAYTGIGLSVFLAITGVSHVMGGIAANSYRLTKIANIKFEGK